MDRAGSRRRAGGRAVVRRRDAARPATTPRPMAAPRWSTSGATWRAMPERHSNRDLARPLPDRKRERCIQPNRAEHERQPAERHEHRARRADLGEL